MPILVIYRKYYGARMAAFLTGTLYVASVAAGYVVETVFGLTGLTPTSRDARVEMAHLSWNYTTWLNIVFLAIAAALVIWFYRSGSGPMLRMMGGSPDTAHQHHDHDHDHDHDSAKHKSDDAQHTGPTQSSRQDGDGATS